VELTWETVVIVMALVYGFALGSSSHRTLSSAGVNTASVKTSARVTTRAS
jgi:hypothetical protein